MARGIDRRDVLLGGASCLTFMFFGALVKEGTLTRVSDLENGFPFEIEIKTEGEVEKILSYQPPIQLGEEPGAWMIASAYRCDVFGCRKIGPRRVAADSQTRVTIAEKIVKTYPER